MLEIEKQKRLAGCTDRECAGEIAGALGVRWVIAGNVGLFGETYLVNLKLFDTANSLVVGRVTRKIRGGEEALLEELPDAARELFDRVGAQLGLQIRDRVTVAARHAQPITESPSTVIVITRKDIEESGATSLVELLRRYPAVHVYAGDPCYPAMMIRGTIRVLVLVDGREVNLEFWVAPFYELIPVGPEEIERIEIVLGPNSALYGANAVSAVFNIQTRKPSTGLHTRFFTVAGEHGSTNLGGALEGGTGPLSLQGTFRIEQVDSWMERGLSAKEMIKTNLAAGLQIGEGELIARGGLVAGSGRMDGALGFMELKDMLTAHVQADFLWRDLKARAYWYGLRGGFDIDMDLYHPDTGMELGSTPTFELVVDTFQVEGQYEFSLFENNLAIAGGDFRLTTLSCEQLVTTDISENRVGLFLHDEHRFSNKVMLTIGARFDVNDKTDAAISPRAALVYKPVKDHFLRISGARAFRKPTLLESSALFRINTTYPEMKVLFEEKGVGNPDLRNEILTGVEIGYRGSFLDQALRVGADAFFNFNRDWISFKADFKFREFGQIDLDNTSIGYRNSDDDFNIVGVNFFVEGEPARALTLFFRGEYRYEWYVSSGEASKVPRYLGSAGGILRLPFGLTIHLAMVHVAAREDDVRDPLSSLEPAIWQELPSLTYLLAAFSYRLQAGPTRIDLGLSLFNPFGGHFREKAGLEGPDGANYGGELLGPRAMFMARMMY
jgi:outer membrane cobalamin receptor